MPLLSSQFANAVAWMKETEARYFNALTGVRAVAAYMVFINHYQPFVRFGEDIAAFFSEMYAGVTVFFVLSGFLITYKYFDVVDFSFHQYMVNRIARIYPMYFLLTLFTFIVFNVKGSGESNFTTFILNVTFLRGFFDQALFSGISQGWSLTVEEIFYILAPLFFLLIVRSKSLIFILPVLLLLIGFVLVGLFSPLKLHGLFGSDHFMLTYTFFGRCFEFFVGIALAIFYKKANLISTKIPFTYVGIVVMIICIWIMSLLRTDTLIGIETSMGRVINALILSVFGIAVFFYGLLTEETIISKILGSKLFVLLGKSSYIFYLIHLGVIASFIQRVIPNTVVIFVVVNLISIALFKSVEDPLNKFIRRKFQPQIH